MSFILTLLLLFLLGVLLAPLLRLLGAIFRAYRLAAQARPQGEAQTPNQGRYGSSWPFGRDGHRRYPKVFAADEGEYVRFEEIEVDAAEEQERRQRFATADFRIEDQVSDAEWTDIRTRDSNGNRR